MSLCNVMETSEPFVVVWVAVYPVLHVLGLQDALLLSSFTRLSGVIRPTDETESNYWTASEAAMNGRRGAQN